MSAMTRFTLRSLSANRVRTLVTVGGVALAAALLTAVLTSYTSLESYLYRDEVQRNGLWTASVRLDSADDALAAVGAEDVHGMATLTDVGFAANDEDAQNRYGRYLPVLAMEGDVGAVCAIEPSEGRLPESADEVMLHEGYRTLLAPRVAERAGEASEASDGQPLPVELGDVVALDLGQREVVVEGGGAGGTTSRYRDYASDPLQLADGMRLDSDAALVTPEPSAEGAASERLVDVQPRRYVVVGFYDRANLATTSGFGATALTGPDPAASGSSALYLVMDAAASVSDMEERVRELFPDVEPYLHSSLLRAMGVHSASGIWSTFYAMVGVLAAVIVVACISLIYNAFAISVAERTRQFGLLASIGASRRQIRRAVLLEALVVAAIGVPLGVALGIGGTAVVLGALGPSLSAIMAGGPDFALHVEPAAVAFAAVLSLAAVLVSGWVPARRAARTSAVDALRRASEASVPAASKDSAARHPWKRRSLGGRVLGLGGQLASINAKRGGARGRTASMSLALAVVLLMTAGSLTTYLSVMVDASGFERPDYDLEVNGGGDAGSGAETVEAFRTAYGRMAEVEGAQPRGFCVTERTALLVPEAMAGMALVDGSSIGGQLQPGTCGATGFIAGLDDEAFRAYAASCGADPEGFLDPAAPRAIALATAYGNDGSSYLYLDAFRRPGTVEVVTEAAWQGQEVQAIGMHADTQPDGTVGYRLVGISKDDASGEGIPFDDLDVATTPVQVTTVAARGPAVAPRAYEPTLVMPLSMVGPWGLLDAPGYDLGFTAAFDAEDHAAAAEALEKVGDGLGGLFESPGQSFFYVQDIQAALDNMQALILVINVFCLLFTVILALIALANVFNTVTNGLILRRREFAVMKSVGMGNRTFRRMIAAECVRYSLRGLIPGLVVAGLVSYGLYRAMALSVEGLAFALPWGYMGLAVALVAVALALSVAYGLHRCKASNVVEALRDLA